MAYKKKKTSGYSRSSTRSTRSSSTRGSSRKRTGSSTRRSAPATIKLVIEHVQPGTQMPTTSNSVAKPAKKAVF